MKLSSALFVASLALASAGHYVPEKETRSPPHTGRKDDRPNQLRGGEASAGKLRDARGSGHATGELRAAAHGSGRGRTRTGHATPKQERQEPEYEPEYDVLIVGAGAAGLSAAHIFDYDGWNYKVLEAHETEIGGRVRQSFEFGDDFNIDLGAEFMHTTQSVGNGKYDSGFQLLQEMVKHKLEDDYKTKYTKQEPRLVTLLPSMETEAYHTPPEYRFAGGVSWYSFLTEEVAYDEVQANIEKGCVVNEIDYNTGTGVKVSCRNGRTFTAWHVIVTVPMKMLQQNSITFKPTLPSEYTDAINSFNIADGFKIWLEFDKQWYPEISTRDADYQSFEKSWIVDTYEKGNSAGYRIFWNEMYPYSTDRHIVGGLIYGDKAKEYEGMSPAQIKDSILNLLTPYVNGAQATFNGNWEVQNWADEPYIESAYTIFADEDYQTKMRTPLPSTDVPKLLFAGEAMNYNWAFVHGAAETGRSQAEKVMDAPEW